MSYQISKKRQHTACFYRLSTHIAQTTMPTAGGLVNRVTVSSPPRKGGLLQPVRVLPMETTTSEPSAFGLKTTATKERGKKLRQLPQVRPACLPIARVQTARVAPTSRPSVAHCLSLSHTHTHTPRRQPNLLPATDRIRGAARNAAAPVRTRPLGGGRRSTRCFDAGGAIGAGPRHIA